MSTRPDTEDFRRLSKLILAQDARADTGEPFEKIISEVVDPESLIYMAEQRALRIAGLRATPTTVMQFASCWMDAFMAGVAFGRTQTESFRAVRTDDQQD